MITEKDITFDFILAHHILGYKEEGGELLPSIREFFCHDPYPFQEKIASYLDKAQYTGLVHFGPKATDYITGERLNNYGYPKTDGVWTFNENIPYYIRKYNLRLPKIVEDYILSRIL